MSEKTYRIGEAAALLNLKAYVLRFWEVEFPQIEPLRTEKGQRLYREEDVAMLRRIRYLLHERGLTIEGARRILAEEKEKRPKASLEERLSLLPSEEELAGEESPGQSRSDADPSGEKPGRGPDGGEQSAAPSGEFPGGNAPLPLRERDAPFLADMAEELDAVRELLLTAGRSGLPPPETEEPGSGAGSGPGSGAGSGPGSSPGPAPGSSPGSSPGSAPGSEPGSPGDAGFRIVYLPPDFE